MVMPSSTWQESFHGCPMAKLKKVGFVGPDVRNSSKTKSFKPKWKTLHERSTWKSFKEVVRKFLGNYKDPDFENIVENMLANLKALGCSVSLKFHFLNSHLIYFSENLAAVSEEQGERFHKDIKEIDGGIRVAECQRDSRLLLSAA